MADEPLTRTVVRVATTSAEEAIAMLLELAPGGFEERSEGDAVVLTVYGPETQAIVVAEAFPGSVVEPVAPGWEDAWKAFHRPVVVGGVWIGPPWERPPSGIASVVIDPGRAFGTGAHPTTRLCVELLSRSPRGSLLDVGCGSGVLALAADRLGYGPLRAVDSDPVAVEVTRENAAANAVTLQVDIADAAVEGLPESDVAVANILLPAVENILPRLRSLTAITSGYLDHERPSATGWRHVDRAEVDGWAADRFEVQRHD
jgi:ribosomal protein L11 methyltransferase